MTNYYFTYIQFGEDYTICESLIEGNIALKRDYEGKTYILKCVKRFTDPGIGTEWYIKYD